MNLTDLRPVTPVDPDGLDRAFALVTAGLDDVTPAPRRRRGAARLGLLGAAAAAAAAVVVLLPNPTDQSAFAGWTAVPARATAADLAAAGDACLELGVKVVTLKDPTFLVGARPAVTDRRGSTSFTVLEANRGLLSCLIGPDVSVAMVAGADGSSVTLMDHGDAGETTSLMMPGDGGAPAPNTVTYATSSVDGIGSAAPWGYAAGRVGADVRAVRVVLVDGTTVTASVHGGVWAAWWPREAVVRSVQVTLDDGRPGVSPAPPSASVALERVQQSG